MISADLQDLRYLPPQPRDLVAVIYKPQQAHRPGCLLHHRVASIRWILERRLERVPDELGAVNLLHIALLD